MSIHGQTIQNVGSHQNPDNPALYADIRGNNPAPGTDIIVYTLKQPTFQNQNWRFTLVDAVQNLYNIQNILTGGFAAPANAAAPAAGQAIVTAVLPFAWKVTFVANNNLNFFIGVPNTQLLWTGALLAPPGPSPAIALAMAAAGNLFQQWDAKNVERV